MMMIEGDGFFQILMPDGNIGYSRNGQFTVNDEGVDGDLWCWVPSRARDRHTLRTLSTLPIGTDGEVSVRVRGQQDNQVVGANCDRGFRYLPWRS